MSALKYDLGLDEDQVVIYADILGFSQAIEQNIDITMETKECLIANLQRNFDDILESVSDAAAKSGIHFTWASDSLVLSGDACRIGSLLATYAQAYYDLSVLDFPLRGALVIGKNYHKSNYWGPATVRAVELEKHVAIYPRLIVTGEDMERLQLDENLRRHFWLDYDGVLFFNTLEYLIEQDRCNYSFLRLIVEKVQSSLNIYRRKQSVSHLKVRQKYEWLRMKTLETLRRHEAKLAPLFDTVPIERREYFGMLTLQDILQELDGN
ncbi:MAG: hypothetical protein FD169_1852 [Bacillota bacterium]|nr:MAG: hypothetical protein FD169_1852 [Bacillota bacterium]